ncbi:MAG TPA: hypothetical protein VGA42_07920 [Gemmatimonadales bacterium]
MAAAKASWVALAALALVACGGGAAEEEPMPVPAGARRAAAGLDPAPAEAGPLEREVFSYSGASRDPFESALANANLGPELPDLTLVAVYLDLDANARNVAVLRERITGRRYTIQEGDRLGRMRVVTIRERNVTFLIDDFGVERRESLSLRRPQEEQTP